MYSGRVGFACASCIDRTFPPTERVLATIAGPSWREVSDLAHVQAEAVAVAIRLGHCDRHAAWLGEIVGLTLRSAAAARAALSEALVRTGGR